MYANRLFMLFPVLLALLLGAPVVLAQSASDYLLSPAADQPNDACGKYVTMQNTQNGLCGFTGDFALFAAGNGTTTTIVIVNPATKDVSARVGFNPSGGENENNGNCLLYAILFGGSPGPADFIAYTILPGTSVATSLVYPGQNNGTFNPPPMPNELQMGSITIAFYGPDEATLDAQQAFETIVVPSGTGADGLDSQTTVPFVRELDATALRTQALPKPFSPESVIAVENVSALSQAVRIAVTVNGSPTTFTTPVLGPNALYEGTFGEAFPDLSPTPEELSRGTITFEGVAGGAIIPEILQPSQARLIRYSIRDPRPRHF